MGRTLNSKPITESAIATLTKRCELLRSKNVHPLMKVVLVGNNSASLSYIRSKKKLCEKIGARFELLHLDESIDSNEFETIIKNLNTDQDTNGFIIQMPVPKQLSHLDLNNMIQPEKDIDGFNFSNLADVYGGNINLNGLLPCTPKGVLKLCDHYKIELEGKNVVIIGRSLIVGKPLSLLMTNRNATVTLCHSRTQNIQSLTKNADIIITALGKENFLTEDFINPDREQYIIDVGINRNSAGMLCGDADFDNLINKVAGIAPVPGGIGPLTVLSLIENLFLATEEQILKNK
jgi:methylenetetrahydrofolate dehydrogenase (NADP+)/methenyltetrahydrofolate cyclohydrolase